jgi:hypothetical protein
MGIYNPDFVNWFHAAAAKVSNHKSSQSGTKVFQWIGFFNCFHAKAAKKKRSDRKDLELVCNQP